MEGHRYFVEGIPLALWKEYKQACIFFDKTAKDHLISCMQDLVVSYHSTREAAGRLSKFEQRRKKKE